MRVLHLIDPASPGGGACTLFLLAEALHRLNSVQQDVLIIGNRRRTDLARRCGVQVTGQLNAPLGLPALARNQLRIWKRMREHVDGRFDIVHAWTIESALLAAHVFRNSRVVVTCSVGPVPGVSIKLLQSMMRRRPVSIVATSPGVMQQLLDLGFDVDALTVLPPAVHPQSVRMTPRHTLRDRWNVDDNTFVVGLLSDPWSWADALAGVDILARPASAGRRLRLLVHHRAHQRVAAERWVRPLGWPDFIITDNNIAEPWSIVNGLDAALFVGRDMTIHKSPAQTAPATSTPGIMPLLWAMAAEVPVVAEANNAVLDVVEDGRNGLLVNVGDRVAASNRILRLHDDHALARRLGGSALQSAHENFDISAYAVRLKDVYEHVIQGLPPHVLGVDLRPDIARFEPESQTWTAR